MTIADPYAADMSSSEKTIDRPEAAKRLSVSLQTLDGYARSGRLRRIRNPITRRVRFIEAQVEALRIEREEGGEEA